MSSQAPTGERLDAIIVGGGVAGLWTLNTLLSSGYSAVLFEADAVGCEQTLASQGMIHGGIKYALGNQLTRASEAIADMPDRWHACLEGKGAIDLRGLQLLAEHYYMFADRGALGRLATFFASKGLRGRIEKLERDQFPEIFRDDAFQGVVYRLNDFVIDTQALLERLVEEAGGSVYRERLEPDQCTLDDDVTVKLGSRSLTARRLILCAGVGNAALARRLNVEVTPMQTRPLHQVMVRHDHPLPLYAHCLTALKRPEPRLTITSHRDGDGWLWYLGGQLATDGVERDSEAQCEFARKELMTCIPWLDWSNARFSSLMVDRAEPQQTGRARPDQAFAEASGPCITCWPTKLALAPDLADRVLALLPAPGNFEPLALDLPTPQIAASAWQRTS